MSEIGTRVQFEMTTSFGCTTLRYGRIADTTREDVMVLTEGHPERLVTIPRERVQAADSWPYQAPE